MPAFEIRANRVAAGFRLEHAVLGATVLVACAVATTSKSPSLLSFFWLSNALMLGLIVRFPVMAQPQGWVLATLGFLLGSYAGEGWFLKVLLLTLANLVGIACGWLYLRQHAASVVQMRSPVGVFHVVVGVCIAAVVGALLGGGAMQYLLQRSWQRTAMMWFGAEMMHMCLIIPLLLNVPPLGAARRLWRSGERAWGRSVAPLAVLVVLMGVGLYIGGPGVPLLLLPGLVLCALSYRVFTVSLLCFLAGSWHVFLLVLNDFDFSSQNAEAAMSMRLGLSMLSVTLLTVACARNHWGDAMARLEHSSTHDHLTGMLTRAAFSEQAHRILARLGHGRQPVALLMLDLDWFKRVNDTYGHAAGDVVLQAVSRTVVQSLRPHELLGRMGGEEFALLLPGADAQEASATAERLCAAIRALTIEVDEGKTLRPTISIGVVALDATDTLTLSVLLRKADLALYSAKENGRDGFCLSA